MTAPGYSRLQIGLHWLIAALLLVSFFSHEAMKGAWISIRRGAPEVTSGASLHVWVGVAVLALVLVRLVIRFARGVPAAPEGTPGWMRLASGAVHWLLYAVLVALPLTGILAWFGGITEVGDVHEVLFNLGWVLVAVHTAAALFHHYVMKDGLITRMTRPV